MVQEMQKNATNISTQGGVRDRMTAANQNSDDTWNVNKCKAVMVSFYEGVCSFHDDLPPHQFTYFPVMQNWYDIRKFQEE